MKNGFCEVICLVDSSVAMSAKTNETISGFNNFMNSFASHPDDIRVTVALFNDTITYLSEQKTVKGSKQLTNRNYKPGGDCALIDSACTIIDDVGVRLSDTSEARRPEKVMIVILTGGVDNASKRFSLADLNERVKHQSEVYSWNFVFLGMHLDSFKKVRKNAKIGPAPTPEKKVRKNAKADPVPTAPEPEKKPRAKLKSGPKAKVVENVKAAKETIVIDEETKE